MNIPWLIAITISILFLQRVIFKRRVLQNIYYDREFRPAAVHAGQHTKLVEQIANRKLLPVPWLRLESRMDESLRFDKRTQSFANGEQFHRSIFSLMPHKRIIRRHRLQCRKRGYYYFDSVAISGGDPFGMNTDHRTLPVQSEIIVYPRRLPTQEIPLPAQRWIGDVIVRRWMIEDPFVNAGVREYRDGDPMNAIHWKSTAKTGELYVHQREHTADREVMIYVNFDTTEDLWVPIQDEELIEKGICIAATMVEALVKEGIPTGFGCNAYRYNPKQERRARAMQRIEPASYSAHTSTILEEMAMLQLRRPMTFSQFLDADIAHAHQPRDIVMISAHITPAMEERMHQLEHKGNRVNVIVLDRTNGVHPSL